MCRRPTALCVVLAVAGVLVPFAAPSAAVAKTEIQRPDEVAYLRLHRHGFEIDLALYPDRGVAVLYTAKGFGGAENRAGRWSGVAYAAEVPMRHLRESVDVTIGQVARVSGSFVADEPPRRGRNNRGCHGPAPVSETGHFVGRLEIHGDGGYLTARSGHAALDVARSFRLRCRHGHAQHTDNLAPGLFGYLEPPTRTFFGSDGTQLNARIRSRHRIVEFAALRHLFEATTTFKAATLERLPGGVAATRWVVVSRVGNSLFRTSPPQEHPASATVEPPAPFAGSAEYTRKSHSLRGPLSVAFPGRRLRLAAGDSRAGICIYTRKMLERICQ